MRDWRSQRVTDNGSQFWGHRFTCSECRTEASFRAVRGMGADTASEVVVDVKSYMTRLAILEQQVREFETKVLEQADTLNKQLAQAKRELEEVKSRLTSGSK